MTDDTRRLLPTAAQRAASLRPLLRVWLFRDAPQLHAASGRIDARATAAGLGVELERLANVLGTTAAALDVEPDAEALQDALLPIGRALAVLDAFGPEHRERWLTRPHELLGGAAPLDLMLGGAAERVALLLETAVNGGG